MIHLGAWWVKMLHFAAARRGQAPYGGGAQRAPGAAANAAENQGGGEGVKKILFYKLQSKGGRQVLGAIEFVIGAG